MRQADYRRVSQEGEHIHEVNTLFPESEGLSGESGLVIQVGLACVLPQHVVDPSAVGLQPVTSGKLGREVHPGSSITPSADLVRDTVLRVLAHALVEGFIGPEVVQVLSNSRRVADVDEETVLAVLHLEGNTASTRANDGFAFVDALRDLDFEALAGGELEDDLGARHESVEDYSKWSANFLKVPRA